MWVCALLVLSCVHACMHVHGLRAKCGLHHGAQRSALALSSMHREQAAARPPAPSIPWGAHTRRVKLCSGPICCTSASRLSAPCWAKNCNVASPCRERQARAWRWPGRGHTRAVQLLAAHTVGTHPQTADNSPRQLLATHTRNQSTKRWSHVSQPTRRRPTIFLSSITVQPSFSQKCSLHAAVAIHYGEYVRLRQCRVVGAGQKAGGIGQAEWRACVFAAPQPSTPAAVGHKVACMQQRQQQVRARRVGWMAMAVWGAGSVCHRPLPKTNAVSTYKS